MARGSIEWRGDTSCRIRIYTGKDPITQKKIYHKEAISGPTRAKCEKAAYARMAEVVTEINQGTWVSPERITFEDYLTKKFLPFKKARVRPKTYDQYEYFARVHVIPALGSGPLQKLTPIMFDSFYSLLSVTKKKRGGTGFLSPVTIRGIHNFCFIALHQAVRWRLIGMNPVESASPPELPDNEPVAYSVEEAKKFIEGIKEEPFRAAYMLYLSNALRRGEAAGLEWPVVSSGFTGAEIRKSIVHTSKGNIEQPPKTKRSRGFTPFSPAMANMLIERKFEQAQEKREWEEKYGPGSYMETDRVFTFPDGRPVTPDYLYRRFKKIIQRLGLRDIPLHSLRKTGATLFYRITKDLRQVRDHLRHAKIETTDQDYVADIPEFQILAGKELDRLLGLSPHTDKIVGCPKDAQSDIQ